MLMAVGEYGASHDSECMDEFTMPQGSEKVLRDQHPHVERLFGVTLNILGVLNQDQIPLQSTGHQQIWLQLEGERKSIVKAKDYIKGLCTPEVIEDFNYPRDMHCIFVGAKGLFLDCLIRATSACVTPQTPGRIRISGLAEGVVMAQSRIHAFLDMCICKPEEQEAIIKRRFKGLVEENTDHHALDLLILPTSVKEQLLFLVEEDKDRKDTQPTTIHQRTSKQLSDNAMSSQALQPGVAPMEFPNNLRLEKPMLSHPIDITKSRPSKGVLRERASEPRELVSDNKLDNNNQSTHLSRQSKKERPIKEVNEDHAGIYPKGKPTLNEKLVPIGNDDDDDDDDFQQISGLLDTIMGRDDGDPGSHAQFSLGTQKEFNMLLDFFKTMGYQESVVLKVLSENGIQEPSQILDKVNMEQSNHEQGTIGLVNRPSKLKGMSPTLSQNDDDDDDDDNNYLLEVMKSAAKNCGYSPSEIVDIGDGSVSGILRKLNEKNNSEDSSTITEVQRKGHQETDLWQQERLDFQTWPVPNASNHEVLNPTVVRPKAVSSNHPVEDVFHGGTQQDIGIMEAAADRTVKGEQNVPVVTGAQRFNEAMQTPFQLNLKNEKGNDQLRHVIIDGSNVAKIHGFHRFFSCRGIALAVQYFWDRGHRNITVFVPQWRMKKDSKAKEQHFLTELNDLGLLSFTPSRTVEGKRITSYDDRFMLQLAERTDGVIVTNDYLRDIFAESQAWQNIIKDRLLQYTFVGDIFMVPDDPLGRNGPPLDQFLTKSSLPKPKSKGHSFAARRMHHSPPKPSSQTEVLNLRDRKPGGHKGREHTDVRSHIDTERLRRDLLSIFPSQETKVDFVLQREPFLSDINTLSELIINLKF
ncbi:protein KHNYN-like [Pseudophryne corroboree]|uniref:protein KHNYN-like n=1 Tax=Pseudophryne corroboree TaxID=495146 RepID=UPI003081DB3F